jgi:hypothetical protein
VVLAGNPRRAEEARAAAEAFLEAAGSKTEAVKTFSESYFETTYNTDLGCIP